MTLFAGLGNPGLKYANTRHNIGFKVLDRLIDDLDAQNISKTTFKGKLYRSKDSLFLKPTTFMNLSGKSLQAVKSFYKIDIENIIVIHDDIDLPFAAMRIKKGGGHGGHNGLKSIDEHISKEYIRVRVGVGKPEHKSQVSDYVLHDFTIDECQYLDKLISHISEACKSLVSEGMNEVKSKYSLKSIESLDA